MAALHHGVPVSDALEVTLREPILQSLLSQDTDRLVSLAAEVNGFHSVFERTVRTEAPVWAKEAPDRALAACISMKGMPQTDDVLAAYDAIRRSLLDQETLLFTESQSSAGLKALLESIQDAVRQDTASRMVSMLSIPPISHKDSGQRNSDLDRWSEFLLGCAVVLHETGLSRIADHEFKIPCDLSSSVSILLHLADSGERSERIQLLTPRCKSYELVDEFIRHLETAEPTSNILTCAMAVIRIAKRLWQNEECGYQGPNRNAHLHIEKLLSPLLELVTVYPLDEHNTRQVQLLVQLLLELSAEDEAAIDAELTNLCQRGRLRSVFNLSLGGRDPGLAAGVVSLELAFAPESRLGDWSLESVLGESSDNHDTLQLRSAFVESVARLSIQYGILPRILKRCCGLDRAIPVLEALFGQLVEDGELLPNIPVSDLVELRPSLKRFYPTAYKMILRRTVDADEHLALLGNIDDTPLRISIAFEASEAAAHDKQVELRDIAVAGLRELREVDWANELSNPGQVSTILVTLRDQQCAINLGEALGLAVIAHGAEMLAQPRLRSDSCVPIDYYVGSLAPPVRTDVEDALVDLLQEKASMSLASFLSRFGSMLVKAQRAQARASVLMREVVPTILERMDLDELRWLDSMCKAGFVAKMRPNFYESLRPLVRETRDRVAKRATPQSRLICAIASAFRLKQKPSRKRTRKASKNTGRQRKPR